MDTRNPITIHRHDYKPFDWSISHTRLHFKLEPSSTRVHSELCLQHVPYDGVNVDTAELKLDGVDLQLLSVAVDGEALLSEQYHLDDDSLTLFNLPAVCRISIDTMINPQGNTALEGLYRSGGNFCTQCEAEGFRKITYYPDRPDVLSVFDVSIEAYAPDYPVMLSNGNLVEHVRLEHDRHRISWHDPHPKPCYLFALVAGKLSVVEDTFVTASGRDVLLQIYVQSHNKDLCDYAMQALKRSMRWDEKVYGFEYDLERFMIVAVDDFNMGAMENKGLNIFNSRFVLADIHSATDSDFLGVEAVIAHEYFHNWTGNRITCRDWFQLSLKEGLTVFRDQCFSSDMHSATVKRIEDVRLLRARQFAEDASPMAHPIRPDSYIEINNFYTLTVYEKGAEVIRMLYTLLGAEDFQRGIEVYVQRHDGSASTCDAFVDAMQCVTTIDLTQFRLWYEVAGTPRLDVTEQYDETLQRYSLHVIQHTPDTAGQQDKPALFIPLVIGLLDEHGKVVHVDGNTDTPGRVIDKKAGSLLLEVSQQAQSFHFEHVNRRPTASLLRGFSAPVKVDYALDDKQLALLIAHDPDAFNRWDALQSLAERVIMARLQNLAYDAPLDALNRSLGILLADDSLDDAFKAEALQLPGIDTLAESLDQIDYPALGAARSAIQGAVAIHHEHVLMSIMHRVRPPEIALLDDRAMGMRSLANTALSLLSNLDDEHWVPIAGERFAQADNMTDRLSALACLCHSNSNEREQALSRFHHGACKHKLILDKWFAVQAMSRRDQVMDDVVRLYDHHDFDIRNPNRARSLIATFAFNNPIAFHASDGRGYRFLAERVLELDALNPQVAARLVAPLTRWARLVEPQRALMCEQLNGIIKHKGLSVDVFELVSKSLNSHSK